MKLFTYVSSQGTPRAGLWIGGQGFDIQDHAEALRHPCPVGLLEILQLREGAHTLERVFHAICEERIPIKPAVVKQILAPLPRPPSCRDAYAFRQHVEAARRNRGMDMIPEYDQFPVFYYTNHQAIFGPGEIPVEKDHLDQLDFELEVAIVIGKQGKNICASEAESFIAGFTLMNDFSARALQMQEMKLSLGPAKGKDFATALGPWLVTPDELAAFARPTPQGTQWDLTLKAWHNGKQVSEGCLGDMRWTFAEIIERVSYGTSLYPGDVIGSGTVGTGCYMELNGTWAREAAQNGETHRPVWLGSGDEIVLEGTGLGVLKNKICLCT